MLATKFSIPYAIGAALVLGKTDVTAFHPDHYIIQVFKQSPENFI
ncbi:MAG: hypothetical protein Ct9H300mP27_10460 [Chloroflexota bacterium]|nr:MAG: hypothetical protein Ct9H300mP27_10460 [Chloroflexota bacterium]